MIPAVLAAAIAKPQTYTPLQLFGSSLKLWLNSSLGFSGGGTSGAAWVDQGAGGATFAETGADDDFPDLDAATQNGFDGISFEASSATDAGARVQSADADYDNFWSGAGSKTAFFGARIDTLTFVGSVARSVLVGKGLASSGVNGWQIFLLPGGSLTARWESTSGGRFEATASAFYSSPPKLVLGVITYDGVFSGTPNLVMKLWDNGSPGSFVTVTPTITNPGGTIGDDSASDLAIGNNELAGFDEPWMGPVFDFGLVSPAPGGTSGIEAWLRRVVP